jgi:O-antigen/teichoic acid export membrane protein
MQIDVILVGRLTTAAAVGMYGLALNLARKADIVNHSLYTSLLPAASGLNDREAVGKYLRQSMVRSGLIGLGLLALMPLVGPFIRIFYGPEYAAATGLLQLLLIVVIIDAFALPVILLLLAVRLIPLIGTPGAAVAKIVASITGFVLVVWRLRLWRLSVQNKHS